MTPGTPITHDFPRRLKALALSALTILLCIVGLALTAAPANAATVSAAQCNGHGPGPLGASTGMTCTVTVVNTIRGGHTSSTTTLVRLCSLGPCAPGNGTFTTSSTNLVTSVNQCNGSDNDSAHPITCNVTITNNISADTPGAQPVTAATVNQCVGSGTGGGGTVDCDPFPATTTGATVTQCNGSGNGAGGTTRCSVDSDSVVSPAIPVRVNQCNGTGNPGGSVVTCSTRISTHITTAVTSSASPSVTPSGGTGSEGVSGSGGSASAREGAGQGESGSGGQVSRVPSGGVETGGGSTVGLEHQDLLTAGGILLLMAMMTLLHRRRARHSA